MPVTVPARSWTAVVQPVCISTAHLTSDLIAPTHHPLTEFLLPMVTVPAMAALDTKRSAPPSTVMVLTTTTATPSLTPFQLRISSISFETTAVKTAPHVATSGGVNCAAMACVTGTTQREQQRTITQRLRATNSASHLTSAELGVGSTDRPIATENVFPIGKRLHAHNMQTKSCCGAARRSQLMILDYADMVTTDRFHDLCVI